MKNFFPIWEKHGQIYNCSDRPFFKSHATRPIPFLVDQNRLRLFFSSRNVEDIPYPTFIDVDPRDPKRILDINEKPLMSLGKVGSFDDSGITPVSILRKNDENLMFYVGWKRRRYGVTIETSIGVAKLTKDAQSIERLFEGPIIGQDRYHPILVAAPFVVPYEEGYRMWYCSGKEWQQMEHGPEMIYTVYEAFSIDGYSWKQKSNMPVINYKYDGEVISAPWVVKLSNNSFLMWYSTRGSKTQKVKQYSPGLAFSSDGVSWVRCDSDVGIELSKSGWDSEMICYPAIFNFRETTYMFYSGNGVGKGGIGFAIANQKLDIINW
jgi:hypothetical protein